MMKVLVIGLDGASWNFLEGFIENGSLPNLKKFREEGVWGNLNSVMPPVTIPSWISFAKGKTPKTMKLYDWFEVDLDERRMEFYNSRSSRLRGEDFWNILGRQGSKTGVINLPGTYPPQRQENGFVITGILTPENQGFTYPEELEDLLLKKYDYRVHPTYDKDQRLDDIKRLIRIRFQVARDFLLDVDCLTLVIQTNDEVQHLYYGCPELEELWKIIDEELGSLIEMNNPGITVLISDHGFQETKYFFYLNNWLIEKGYLVLGQKALRIGKALQKGKYGRIRKVAGMLGVKDIAKRMIFKKPPDDFRKIIPNEDGSYGCDKLVYNMDWERSLAFIINSVIYFKDRVVADDLINNLRKIGNPFNDEKLFTDIKHEINLIANQNRIVVYTEANGVGIRTRYGNGIIWSDKPTLKGIHARKGIYLFIGENFLRKSGRYADLDLIDIAPTILHLYGIQAPKEMEGKALGEVFNLDTGISQGVNASEALTENLPEEDKGFSPQEEEMIVKRLKDLGYL